MKLTVKFEKVGWHVVCEKIGHPHTMPICSQAMVWHKVSQKHASYANISIPFAAIPIVAEDTYLQWLDAQFRRIDQRQPWTLWRDLLRKFRLSAESSADDNENDADEPAGVLEEIFDANEANVFGETLFACFKCYQYLLRHIDSDHELNVEDRNRLKTTISSEFPMLANF